NEVGVARRGREGHLAFTRRGRLSGGITVVIADHERGALIDGEHSVEIAARGAQRDRAIGNGVPRRRGPGEPNGFAGGGVGVVWFQSLAGGGDGRAFHLRDVAREYVG